MSRHSQNLKKVLYTPVKDATPTAFHGETRCLTREARSIIRFVTNQNLLPILEIADVFDSTRRAIERVVSNKYNHRKVGADDLDEDEQYIHPTLLGMLEDWAKKTKKQLKKERKRSDESAASAESNESQESVSTVEKSTKQEKRSESKQASVTNDANDSQTPITRQQKKSLLPSPPASFVTPTRRVNRKRDQPDTEAESDEIVVQTASKAKRARRSVTLPDPEDSDENGSEFETLLAFFKDLNYIPPDLERLNQLGLGPAELLLTRTFDKEEVEKYFNDTLESYTKPIVVRTMAHIVHSAPDKHWKNLEKAK